MTNGNSSGCTLILSGGAFDGPPALRSAPADQQRHGVKFALEVLNLIRKAPEELFQAFHNPGAEDARPNPDHACETGRGLRDMGTEDVCTEIGLFWRALLDQEAEGVEQDVIADEIDGASHHEDFPCQPPKQRLFESGVRLCHRLVGIDNRVGLLAEMNALHFQIEELGPAVYNCRMHGIANHAEKMAAREEFGGLIEECLGDSAIPIDHVPPLEEVACQALVNGVSEVAGRIIAPPVKPSEELETAFAATKQQIKTVTRLMANVSDLNLRTMAEALPIYQERAGVVIDKTPRDFDALLNKLGVSDCIRLSCFIKERETDDRLKELIINDIFAHFLPRPEDYVFVQFDILGRDMGAIASELGRSLPEVEKIYARLLDRLDGAI